VGAAGFRQRRLHLFDKNRPVSVAGQRCIAAWNRQGIRAMPTTTSAEASLINDAEFLDQGQFRPVMQEPAAAARPFRDAFDALDSGLPVDEAAPQPVDGEDRSAPIADSYPLPTHPSFAPESSISLIAAALVLAACLSAGAATAAYVFHDQLTQITERLSANR
jgi:hypothetical protein